jgi:hypothetical protein
MTPRHHVEAALADTTEPGVIQHAYARASAQSTLFPAGNRVVAWTNA